MNILDKIVAHKQEEVKRQKIKDQHRSAKRY